MYFKITRGGIGQGQLNFITYNPFSFLYFQFNRKKGDIWLFIILVPKVLNNGFLFVNLTTSETLLYFNWLVHKVECPNVSTTNCNPQKAGLILCFIIRDVHQFIHHCLIPLDSWIKAQKFGNLNEY